VIFKVDYRIAHLFSVIDDRCHSDLRDKFVPSLALTVLAVIYVQEGIPSEYEIGIGFLFKVWLKKVRIELLVVLYLDLVLGQTELIILKYSGCTAGYQIHDSNCHDQYASEAFHRNIILQNYRKMPVSQNFSYKN
jgi:hypothetical protein